MPGIPDFAALRKRFPVLERSYFATPCLGPFPEEMLADLDDYRRSLSLRNRALEGWVERMQELIGLIEGVIAAPAGTVALRDSATACQAAIAATLTATAERRRIVIAPDVDFHSSRYLWAARAARGFEVVEVRATPATLGAALVAALDERVAAVAVPWVSPRSGALLPIAEIAVAARRVGAISIVDAYQGVGVVPLDVGVLGADIVVGGVHKWLYGGSMGLAFMYVRPDFVREPAFPGWIGHASLGGCEPRFRPATGARRFQQGTPAMEPIYSARAGLRFIAEVGVPAIRARSLELTARLLARADDAGIPVSTPRAAAARGGMVCLDVPNPEDIVRELCSIGFDIDTRPGAGVRIGPVPFLDDSECDDLMTAMAHMCRSI